DFIRHLGGDFTSRDPNKEISPRRRPPRRAKGGLAGGPGREDAEQTRGMKHLICAHLRKSAAIVCKKKKARPNRQRALFITSRDFFYIRSSRVCRLSGCCSSSSSFLT